MSMFYIHDEPIVPIMNFGHYIAETFLIKKENIQDSPEIWENLERYTTRYSCQLWITITSDGSYDFGESFIVAEPVIYVGESVNIRLNPLESFKAFTDCILKRDWLELTAFEKEYASKVKLIMSN